MLTAVQVRAHGTSKVLVLDGDTIQEVGFQPKVGLSAMGECGYILLTRVADAVADEVSVSLAERVLCFNGREGLKQGVESGRW